MSSISSLDFSLMSSLEHSLAAAKLVSVSEFLLVIHFPSDFLLGVALAVVGSAVFSCLMSPVLNGSSGFSPLASCTSSVDKQKKVE